MPTKGNKSPFRGIPRSEELKKKVSGINSPHFGKHLSEKTKQKIGLSHKGEKSYLYGKHRTEETKQKIRLAKKGKLGKRGVESCHYGKPGKRGIESCHWKGGITPLYFVIRSTFKFRQWRSDVFTRDNFTCQECSNVGYKLNAHHIKSFSSIIQKYEITTLQEALDCEELWNINNGITLCIKCHKLTYRKNYKCEVSKSGKKE